MKLENHHPMKPSQFIKSISAFVFFVFLLGSSAQSTKATENELTKPVEKTITDKKGRVLKVLIIAVDGQNVTVRRQEDGRQFTLELDSLDEDSGEMLKSLGQQKPDEPQPVNLNPIIMPSISDELLSYFNSRWQNTKSAIPDIKDEKSTFTSKHLNQLIELERDLVFSASPKDPAKPIQWGVKLSKSKQLEVANLRQQIRDAEVARIFKVAGISNDTKNESKISREVSLAKLTDLYYVTIRPHKNRIKQANQTILSEKKRSTPDDEKLALAKEEVAEANDEINKTHEAFFGFVPGSWLDINSYWPSDHPAEILRKEINELRKSIHEKLIQKSNHSGETENRYAEIEGITISSMNFGVILDISGSMQSHIAPLKIEIEKHFQSPMYREINGCSLSIYPDSEAPEIADYVRTGNSLDSIEEMLIVNKVDTIYWFCDLNDPRSDEALNRIEELLRMTGAKFYVRSVGKKPDAKLKALIDEF
jgi:hypothetical protein